MTKTKKPLLPVFIAVTLLFGMLGCGLFTPKPTALPGPVKVNSALSLNVAFTAEMMPFAREMANRFNASSAAGQVKVNVVEMESTAMVAAINQPDPQVQAISPDSRIWLNKQDAVWSEAHPDLGQRISSMNFYAISPVVIAMWQDLLTGGSKTISWNELKDRAAQGLKWNHPTTSQTSGLSSTLAEFYASAKVLRGLTKEMALSPEVVKQVAAIERSVRFYGDNELTTYGRLKTDGTNILDAFVSQEALLITWNKDQPRKLVALYPSEGTLWADHPIVMVQYIKGFDSYALTDGQNNAYYEFVKFLRSQESQEYVLSLGFRPVNANVSITGTPNSPFATNTYVDAQQPRTVLQIPSNEVMQIVENSWSITKKPTNVEVVVDTSGSMKQEGKLDAVKVALKSFISGISGINDTFGMIEFGSEIKTDTGLLRLDDAQRQKMLEIVDNMEAGQDTALIDAIGKAVDQLRAKNDPDAINAIVVLTDGIENASRMTLQELTNKLTDTNGVKIIVFSIAYGKDPTVSESGENVIEKIATVTDPKGQFFRADTLDITNLYALISKYLQ
jgi:Ca-activated chloride channel family protein